MYKVKQYCPYYVDSNGKAYKCRNCDVYLDLCLKPSISTGVDDKHVLVCEKCNKETACEEHFISQVQPWSTCEMTAQEILDEEEAIEKMREILRS